MLEKFSIGKSVPIISTFKFMRLAMLEPPSGAPIRCRVLPPCEINHLVCPIRIFLHHPQRAQAHGQPADVFLGDGAIIHENDSAMVDALLRPIFEQRDDR